MTRPKKKLSGRTVKQRNRISITYSHRHGVHVQGTVLWMDGFPPHGLGFLSNAHVRISQGTAKMVATKTTVALAGLPEHSVLISPYDRIFAIGKLDLELFPSGHIPGSAALLVRWDKGSFIYTGSFNPKGAAGEETCQVRRSDVLIMESRYGHPDFVFPQDRVEILESLVEKCKELVAVDRTPVLLVSRPLGKAQVIAEKLDKGGIPVQAHHRVTEGSRRLRKLGYPTGNPRRLNTSKPVEGAVIWLATAHKAPSLKKLKNPIFILVSGEAIRPQATSRLGAEDSVILSDDADFPSIVNYVERVGARRVALLPGRAHILADHLPNKDVEILEPTQLSMF